MRKEMLKCHVRVLLLFLGVISTSRGIGISPARWTVDFPEYGTFSRSMGYTLTRPSTQYSRFSTLNPAGLNCSITGCSASGGVEYLDEHTLLINWASPELASLSTIRAYIDVSTPTPWVSTVLPGTGYMDDLVIHSDVLDNPSGIGASLRVVSQISIYRNYALKGNVVGIQNSYLPSQAVQFDVEVKDYLVSQGYLFWFDFDYTIDWESDGIIDASQLNVRMTDELGQTGDKSLAAGFKYKTLNFEHAYSNPGDFMVTLNMMDHLETTTVQIPVHVIPEPVSLLLLGCGGLLLRRKHK